MLCEVEPGRGRLRRVTQRKSTGDRGRDDDHAARGDALELPLGAKAQGVSRATVQRIWGSHGLQTGADAVVEALERPGVHRDAGRCRWPLSQTGRRGRSCCVAEKVRHDALSDRAALARRTPRSRPGPGTFVVLGTHKRIH